MVFGIGRRKDELDEGNDGGRASRSRPGSEIARHSPSRRRRLRERIQSSVEAPAILRSPTHSSTINSGNSSNSSNSGNSGNSSNPTHSRHSRHSRHTNHSGSPTGDPQTVNTRRSVPLVDPQREQPHTSTNTRVRTNTQVRPNTRTSSNSQTSSNTSHSAEFNIDGANIIRVFEGLAQYNNIRSREFSEANIAELQRTAIQLQGIFEQSIRNVFLNVSTPSETISPPADEYNTIDEEIPPYNVTLHKYLDRISFDPRFSPVLRINRKLVKSSKDLSKSIEEFQSFNLLPSAIDPWTISHVDDSEFEDMIPRLIQIENDLHYESSDVVHEDVDQEVLDRVIATSLLESEFYRTIPSQPPRYRKKWLQTKR